jgi:outer membrane protein OmpA-like peptidoglycan-associated protein
MPLLHRAGLVLLLACMSMPLRASAEPLLISFELGAALPLTSPQSELFKLGVSGSVAAFYPLAPQLQLGARIRAGFLGDGVAPRQGHVVDPGVGTFETANLILRVLPFSSAKSGHRASGWFIDGGAGGVLTGDVKRLGLEAGTGYGFVVDGNAIAPSARYVQVLQPNDPLSGEDARLVLFGVEITLGGAREATPEAIVEAPSDRDHDGIVDAEDKCVDAPEDIDNFKDDDGCPEPDNDGDGILDFKDKCPNAAEDKDKFEDEDGCPDPDNDKDTVLDANDECPLDAEVINGNKDFDGCPDEGLIEFIDDRIVLEERVLFDSERARIKRAGRPVMQAIATLQAQHPEWINIRIEGHADTRGDAAFNMELSKHRAENVRSALIKLGIPANLIEAEGYGSTRPRDMRDEPEANQRNRRVEFVVVAHAASASDAATKPSAPEQESGEAPIVPKAASPKEESAQ